MEESIEKTLRKYPAGKKDSLIPLLQEIQREAGHLSDNSLLEVSRYMNIPLNKIYGVASFYDQFNFMKKGRHHIQVCNGTACHINHCASFRAEIEKILQVKAGQTTKDGRFSLEIVNCLGACSNTPVIFVNEKAYGNLTLEEAQKLLSGLKATNE